MNYIIDGFILLCLGWGAYKGFKKGFIIQSFSIIALVLAIWGGFAFAGMLEPFLQKHFSISEPALSIVSFVVIFLFLLILVYTSGWLVSKMAGAATLGMMNRLAGAAFGIFANALVLSVVIVLLNRVNEKTQFMPQDKLEKSFLYEPVGKVAPFIFPEKFFKKVKDTLAREEGTACKVISLTRKVSPGFGKGFSGVGKGFLRVGKGFLEDGKGFSGSGKGFLEDGKGFPGFGKGFPAGFENPDFACVR